MKTQVTLPNGLNVTLDGNAHEIQAFLASQGMPVDDGKHYNSSTKGVVKIEEMATPHIKNTICKLYREWASELSHITSNRSFVDKLIRGPETPTMKGLIKEMRNRL